MAVRPQCWLAEAFKRMVLKKKKNIWPKQNGGLYKSHYIVEFILINKLKLTVIYRC